MSKLAAAPILPLLAFTLAIAIFAAQGPSSALAATFNVDSTADAVDANQGDGNCAAAGGACTLRAAIMEANSTANTADVINLPAGTYTLTIPGTGENNSHTADLDVNSDLTINGAGAQTTIIDGGGLERVIQIPGRDDLTLNDVTITGGDQNGRGGGIFNAFRGDLTINRSIIQGNSAATYGGGISSIEADVVLNESGIFGNTAEDGGGGVDSDSGTLDLNDVEVTGNSTTGGAADGGGIGMTFAGSITVDESLFSDNHAENGGGGISTGGPITVASTTFDNNTAFRGGAFYLLFGNTADAAFSDVWVTNNRSATDGGAIYIDGGPFTLDRGTLSNNVAGLALMNGASLPAGGSGKGSGGAIYIEKTQANVAIDNSTIDNNFASSSGGGIYTEGALTVTNTTISSNSSSLAMFVGLPSGITVGGRGGGILVADGDTDLVSTTVADNIADTSAGVQKDGGSLSIVNTILADNLLGGAMGMSQPSAFFGSDCGTVPITSLGNNLVGSNDCNMIPADGDIVGAQEDPVDPLLDDLAENGGPTMTQALLQGSPAIDAGDPGDCPSTDQRGYFRFGVCDIGAFEFGGTEGEPQKFGDLDCDGDNDSVDALKQLQDIAGIPYGQEQGCPPIGEEVTINGDQAIWGDNDCDGDSDSVDALKQLQNVAGIPYGQEQGCPEIGDPILLSVG